MTKVVVDHEKRRFLRLSTSLASVLVVGINLDACSMRKQTLSKFDVKNETLQSTVWVKIHANNAIEITVPSVEMGQGVATALPMMLAEEMEADWSLVTFKLAEANSQFKNPLTRRQQTGSSKSVRGYWNALREAGSSIKQLLILSAAKEWQVPVTECSAKQSKVIHQKSGRAINFGELIHTAQHIPIPNPGPLKEPKNYRIIGTSQRRLDSLQKVNGAAIFGQDIQIPDMLVAVVQRAPFLAKLKHYDATKALEVKDVIDVIEIDTGIAIVAKHYWGAIKARNVLKIEWDDSESQKLNPKNLRELFIKKLSKATVVDEQGDIEEGIDQAHKKLTAIYELPFLAHACMEPMNCTAHVQANRCDIWASTQGPGPAKKLAAKLTKLDPINVHVHPTFVGGGFGRRSEKDFLIEAIQLSQRLKKPVKVMWSREDDIQHDYYRPASYNEISGGVDEKGMPIFWQHKFSSPSILNRIVPFITISGLDPTATEGASDLPYRIEHQQIKYALAKNTVPVGFWRSVGSSINGYVRECFIDELAKLGGKDPYRLRQNLLRDHPRILGVLNHVAEKSGWDKPLSKGKYRGIAVVESFESYVAQVVEIRLDKTQFVVEKVYCAVDCGLVVNPLSVEAQMQGGIIFGLTAALKGNITVSNGRVEQSNFHDYPLLQINETPEIEIHIIPSNEPPTGIGEPGVPPIAPALANAILSATGTAVRKLPINSEKIRSQMA